MNVVLDAGALIAIDRDDRKTIGLLEFAHRSGSPLITSSPVLAQAWRDGARQARLSRALKAIDVRDVTSDDARAAGELLRESKTSDVVDALLALLATSGDQVLTSDPLDLAELLSARCVQAELVHV